MWRKEPRAKRLNFASQWTSFVVFHPSESLLTHWYSLFTYLNLFYSFLHNTFCITYINSEGMVMTYIRARYCHWHIPSPGLEPRVNLKSLYSGITLVPLVYSYFTGRYIEVWEPQRRLKDPFMQGDNLHETMMMQINT